jgi:hypothetical protein
MRRAAGPVTRPDLFERITPTVDTRTNLRIAYAAAWCGPIFLVGYIVSFGLLGWNHPPPSPAYSPQELVEHYFAPHHDQIMIGMVICMVVGVFYLPWSAASSVIMYRKEHRSPVLSNISLLAGGLTAWILAEFPGKILHAASYGSSRPELQAFAWREAWYIYDMTYMVTGFEMIAVGIYALTDKSDSPVWPRWAGWVAIGGALSFVPESVIPYVTSGPFAVNGLWNFWVAFPWWLIWFGIYSYYLLRYIKRQLIETAKAPIQAHPEVASATVG